MLQILIVRLEHIKDRTQSQLNSALQQKIKDMRQQLLRTSSLPFQVFNVV